MDKVFKYELFNKMIRDFAVNEVKPLAHEVDEQERFPYETVEKMAKLGLMGIIVPKEYGGMGGDYKMYIKAVEELSKVCATTGVILSAHTSLCIAPIMEYGNEEQKKKYRVLDNKTNELAEWDFDLLEEEIDGLDFDGFDFGFEMSEFEEPQTIIEDEPPEVDEENEPITQLGDIWQLGAHRLMCGDSTSETDIDKLIDGEKADMVVTDPPYNVAISNSQGMTIKNDNMDSNSFREFLYDCFKCLNKALKQGGAFYVWYASREHINFEGALNDAGLTVREQLIWNKNTFILGRQDYHWKHEPCLYGWKDGAPHYFVDDRTQSTVIEDA